MQPDISRQPVVSARNLVKRYRRGNSWVEALRGVDLQVYPGEFLAIVGPSGGGKSTLLNLLAGLDEPTEGEVYLNGTHLGALSENERALLRRKRVGFVFQAYDLLPLLTVRENVELPLAVIGIRPRERMARSRELLGRVGLPDHGDATVDELSGGQRQRVAVARMLAPEPSIIFADEPTGSLDTATGREVLGLLREAVEDLGAALVMVTHDEEDARQSDRTILLKDGRLGARLAA